MPVEHLQLATDLFNLTLFHKINSAIYSTLYRGSRGKYFRVGSRCGIFTDSFPIEARGTGPNPSHFMGGAWGDDHQENVPAIRKRCDRYVNQS